MASPEHVKRLSLLLERHVSQFEDANGEIDAELPESNEEETSDGNQLGFNANE